MSSEGHFLLLDSLVLGIHIKMMDRLFRWYTF